MRIPVVFECQYISIWMDKVESSLFQAVAKCSSQVLRHRAIRNLVKICLMQTKLLFYYRDRLKGVQILLSNSQAGPGRKVKQEQEEISRNHVQAF